MNANDLVPASISGPSTTISSSASSVTSTTSSQSGVHESRSTAQESRTPAQAKTQSVIPAVRTQQQRQQHVHGGHQHSHGPTSSSHSHGPSQQTHVHVPSAQVHAHGHVHDGAHVHNNNNTFVVPGTNILLNPNMSTAPLSAGNTLVPQTPPVPGPNMYNLPLNPARMHPVNSLVSPNVNQINAFNTNADFNRLYAFLYHVELIDYYQKFVNARVGLRDLSHLYPEDFIQVSLTLSLS